MARAARLELNRNMNDTMRETVKRHRPAAIYGGIAGLVVVLAILGWKVVDVMLTPDMPNVAIAGQPEIVRYVSDSRGLAELPDIEQQQFLEKWKQNVTTDAKRKDELRAAFDSLDDKSRKAFTESIVEHGKRHFLDDARRYHSLPDTARFKFLRERIDAFMTDAMFMKDVAMAFKRDVDTSPDAVQRWVLEHTTAEERAIGEPYLNAFRNMQLQMRKEQRTTAPASQPALATVPASP
jgi:hypothetical protein